MKQIGIGGMSPKQVSRLRNGHKVRVGCGLGELIVHPERYDAMDRVFRKGKKMTIQLTPEELSANRTMTGKGIFGPGFDKFLSKIGIKKQVYALGDKIKAPVKKAIKAFTDKAPLALGTAGATLASAVGAPELAPLAIMAGKELGKKASKYSDKHLLGYIDDPEAYQKNPSKFADMSGVGLRASPMGRGVVQVGDGPVGIHKRRKDGTYEYVGPYPKRVGDGLNVSARGRGMIGGGHPAMASQPYDQSFHQRFQMVGMGLSL